LLQEAQSTKCKRWQARSVGRTGYVITRAQAAHGTLLLGEAIAGLPACYVAAPLLRHQACYVCCWCMVGLQPLPAVSCRTALADPLLQSATQKGLQLFLKLGPQVMHA
jgi:hypothetical protein